MNQLTTIASMPSGAGCAAALPAEVGERPARVWIGIDLASGPEIVVTRTFTAEEIVKHFAVPTGNA